MADLTPHEFARAVQNACHHSALVVSYDVRILDDVVVKIRHPFDHPTQHVPNEAVTFAEFLGIVEKRFSDDQ